MEKYKWLEGIPNFLKLLLTSQNSHVVNWNQTNFSRVVQWGELFAKIPDIVPREQWDSVNQKIKSICEKNHSSEFNLSVVKLGGSLKTILENVLTNCNTEKDLLGIALKYYLKYFTQQDLIKLISSNTQKQALNTLLTRCSIKIRNDTIMKKKENHKKFGLKLMINNKNTRSDWIKIESKIYWLQPKIIYRASLAKMFQQKIQHFLANDSLTILKKLLDNFSQLITTDDKFLEILCIILSDRSLNQTKSIDWQQLENNQSKNEFEDEKLVLGVLLSQIDQLGDRLWSLNQILLSSISGRHFQFFVRHLAYLIELLVERWPIEIEKLIMQTIENSEKNKEQQSLFFEKSKPLNRILFGLRAISDQNEILNQFCRESLVVCKKKLENFNHFGLLEQFINFIGVF
ncbi:hypothetical protein M0812_16115 [Anaeramoeba flamelloides]|uniref:Uncharacterized protein n=1 Tax=Anaeramoeba flamelloides TaxID=1746091 RepID=A0AAV7ZDI6_9EUKA|nr:hypothetical protein M0812_16115 [Anaeramoeba flamelloides]